jgi:hypothetical protein
MTFDFNKNSFLSRIFKLAALKEKQRPKFQDPVETEWADEY